MQEARRHETRRTLAGVILVACALTLGLAVPGAAGARTSKAIRLAEARIRGCANRERRVHGLAPLHASRALHRAAHLHARDMARRDFFAHVDPWMRSPGERIHLFSSRPWSWGENIAAGFPSVHASCVGWMRSPGHRANILDPRFKWVGGGFARTSRGRYRTYFVMDLGTPGGS